MKKYRKAVLAVLCTVAVMCQCACAKDATIYLRGNTLKYKTEEEFSETADFANAEAYDPQIAQTLCAVSWAAYNFQDNTDKNASKKPYVDGEIQSTDTREDIENTNIYKSLSELGFSDIALYDYYKAEDLDKISADNSAYAIAHKNCNGKQVVIVALRGSYGGMLSHSSEWVSNLNVKINENNNHTGFDNSAKYIELGIEKYTKEQKIKEPFFVITGHSRGAAVANIIEADLSDKYSQSRVLGYNFACPDVTVNSQKSASYNNIFNVCNSKDIVCYLPRIMSYLNTDPKSSTEKIALEYILSEANLTRDEFKRASENCWYKNGTTLWFEQSPTNPSNSGTLNKLFEFAAGMDTNTHYPYEYFRKLKEKSEQNAYRIEKNLRIVIGQKPIVSDVCPRIVNGRVMLPLRAIFEALGATVEWNQQTQSATAVMGDVTVRLKVGSNIINVNGSDIAFDTAATLENSRVMVPARAAAEAFGNSVLWDNEAMKVSVIK